MKNGWPNTAYGVSKVCLTKASYILGEQLAKDPRNIVMNSVRLRVLFVCPVAFVVVLKARYFSLLRNAHSVKVWCYITTEYLTHMVRATMLQLNFLPPVSTAADIRSFGSIF